METQAHLELQQVRSKLKMKQEEVLTKDRVIQELKSKVENLISKNQEQSEDILQLQSLAVDYSVEIKQLQSQIKQLEGDKKTDKDEIKKLRDEMKKLRDEIKQLREDKKNIIDENEDLQLEKEMVEWEKEDCESKNVHLRRKLDHHINELQKYKKNAIAREEFDKMKNDCSEKIKKLEKRLDDMVDMVDFHMVYIAQVGYQLAMFVYYLVLGDPKYRDYEHKYYMTDLEKIINEIPNDREQKLAREKWEKLKAKLKWKQEMGEKLKILRQKRIPAAHPSDLKKPKAMESIEELKLQERLDETLSESTLKIIVSMWETISSLIPEGTKKSLI